MSARVIDCDDCETTGHVWRHLPLDDDPYYLHETNEARPACEGEGFIEIEDEPISLDDLDAGAAMAAREPTPPQPSEGERG